MARNPPPRLPPPHLSPHLAAFSGVSGDHLATTRLLQPCGGPLRVASLLLVIKALWQVQPHQSQEDHPTCCPPWPRVNPTERLSSQFFSLPPRTTSVNQRPRREREGFLWGVEPWYT